MNKKILILGVVMLAVGSGFIWYKNQNTFDPSVDVRTFKTAGEFENYYKNLDELYKKDTHGGATPEETLQLFIDALKKGDTELAAKYYLPEKQKEEAEDLVETNRNGFLNSYIQILDGTKRISKFSDGSYEFLFFDKNGKQIHIERFVFNPSTKVWKIESL